jgi:putative acetyltransferase
MQMVTVLATPSAPGDWDAVRLLLREYAAQLGVDLCFQDFEAELANLPGHYAAPRGALLIARMWTGSWQVVAGCVRWTPRLCQRLRNEALVCAAAVPRLGLGRLLAEGILDAARQAAYACVLLDTLSDMETARALYQDLGSSEIPPYYYNPIPGSHYLKARSVSLSLSSALGLRQHRAASLTSNLPGASTFSEATLPSLTSIE